MNSLFRLDETYCVSLLNQVQARCERVRNPPAPYLFPGDYTSIHNHPDRFDPMAWFDLFGELRMADGYVLDFVYELSGNSGGPRLYARRQDAPRLDSPAAPTQDGPDRNAWQARVTPTGTPQSLFEMVLLARIAHRFHRYWHAFADNAEFICDRRSLARILNACPEPGGHPSPPGGLSLPREVVLSRTTEDIPPLVDCVDGSGRVTLLSWRLPGGLSRQVYAVEAGAPVRTIRENVICRVSGGPVF